MYLKSLLKDRDIVVKIVGQRDWHVLTIMNFYILFHPDCKEAHFLSTYFLKHCLTIVFPFNITLMEEDLINLDNLYVYDSNTK